MTATRQFYNPVFTGLKAWQVKRQLQDEQVADRMERDPWYAFNLGRLTLNYRLGLVNDVIHRNVAAHLRQVALRRNMI